MKKLITLISVILTLTACAAEAPSTQPAEIPGDVTPTRAQYFRFNQLPEVDPATMPRRVVTYRGVIEGRLLASGLDEDDRFVTNMIGDITVEAGFGTVRNSGQISNLRIVDADGNVVQRIRGSIPAQGMIGDLIFASGESNLSFVNKDNVRGNSATKFRFYEPFVRTNQTRGDVLTGTFVSTGRGPVGFDWRGNFYATSQ